MAKCVKLFSGVELPLVGLGTWKSKPGEVQNAVKSAFSCGYRHIDCAACYGNEKEVGDAFKETIGSVVERKDVFITSKLWNTKHAAVDVKPACIESLKDLQLDYLDLYLIHWPYGFVNIGENFPKNPDGTIQYSDVSLMETWGAMEKLVDEGLCKHIGLSNCNSKQVAEVLEKGRIKPAVLQVECHPYFNQERLINFCKEKDIVVTASSPLGSPDRPWAKSSDIILVEEPTLKAIGDKYKKSPAQVALRFNVQRGVVVIPKSITPARIAQNLEVCDFELSAEDMKKIESLHNEATGRVCVPAIEVDGKRVPRDAKHPLYPFNEPF
ncbi:aldo-keto reductase family 1 member A1-like [Saccoglossus kowalevskii]|uniref:Alcohol dehydrogenase [NADP(+)]-like n=1 Tax=Saccoglossus kowalevskii TaxID=10224 RepID=A0ABM0H0S1_SACKO|nr:PREDICTED: alcohol dehydrogenase [NADP(+)]-like [Saccoglossus kowalevskii]